MTAVFIRDALPQETLHANPDHVVTHIEQEEIDIPEPTTVSFDLHANLQSQYRMLMYAQIHIREQRDVVDYCMQICGRYKTLAEHRRESSACSLLSAMETVVRGVEWNLSVVVRDRPQFCKKNRDTLRKCANIIKDCLDKPGRTEEPAPWWHVMSGEQAPLWWRLMAGDKN